MGLASKLFTVFAFKEDARSIRLFFIEWKNQVGVNRTSNANSKKELKASKEYEYCSHNKRGNF